MSVLARVHGYYHFYMLLIGQSTISMAIFNSKLFVYQMVYHFIGIWI